MDKLHTKQVGYNILSLIALVLSVVFAFRAALVYNTFFFAFSHDILFSEAIAVIVFIAITALSFVISIHWENDDKLHWAIAVIVLFHDVGGMLYVMYAHQSLDYHNVMLDNITLAVCVFSALPVLIGMRLEKMYKELEPEREQLFQDWVNNFERLLERRGAGLYEQLTRNPKILIHHSPPQLQKVLQDKGMTLVVDTVEDKFLWVIPRTKLKASVSGIKETSLPENAQTNTRESDVEIKKVGFPDRFLEEPTDTFEEDEVPLNFPMRAGITQEVQTARPAKDILNQQTPSTKATALKTTGNFRSQPK